MSQFNRIISLVPSLTELLIDLGLKEKIIGRTRFCVHPNSEVENIPILGGTKNPRVDDIVAAKPDLVIANREENRKEDIEALEAHSEVVVTDISTIEDAMLAIHRIGLRLHRVEEAAECNDGIRSALDGRPDVRPLRTVYYIWKDPWMSIGGDTYIDDVMAHWKLENVCGSQARYPTLPLKDLERHRPELILLSSEPYPFREKHLPEVTEACPGARVLLVEGEWFSWYGSRMKEAFRKLNAWRRAIS